MVDGVGKCCEARVIAGSIITRKPSNLDAYQSHVQVEQGDGLTFLRRL
jgi:hypothetical protein